MRHFKCLLTRKVSAHLYLYRGKRVYIKIYKRNTANKTPAHLCPVPVSGLFCETAEAIPIPLLLFAGFWLWKNTAFKLTGSIELFLHYFPLRQEFRLCRHHRTLHKHNAVFLRGDCLKMVWSPAVPASTTLRTYQIQQVLNRKAAGGGKKGRSPQTLRNHIQVQNRKLRFSSQLSTL